MKVIESKLIKLSPHHIWVFKGCYAECSICKSKADYKIESESWVFVSGKYNNKIKCREKAMNEALE